MISKTKKQGLESFNFISENLHSTTTFSSLPAIIYKGENFCIRQVPWIALPLDNGEFATAQKAWESLCEIFAALRTGKIAGNGAFNSTQQA